MNNLFSKSPETYEKLIQQIDIVLGEMRHQRNDLSTIKRQLHTLQINLDVQKQVDDYFDDESHQNTPPISEKQDLD